MVTSRHEHQHIIKPKFATILWQMLQVVLCSAAQSQHQVQHCHTAWLHLHLVASLSVEGRNIISTAAISIKICARRIVEL